MKRILIFLVLCLFMGENLTGQQWIWSKVIPEYFGFNYYGLTTNSTGEHFLKYESDYYTGPSKKSFLIHLDSSGTMVDSIHFDFQIGEFAVDDSCNIVTMGTYSDSFTYQGTTIFSDGQYGSYIRPLA